MSREITAISPPIPKPVVTLRETSQPVRREVDVDRLFTSMHLLSGRLFMLPFLNRRNRFGEYLDDGYAFIHALLALAPALVRNPDAASVQVQLEMDETKQELLAEMAEIINSYNIGGLTAIVEGRILIAQLCEVLES